MALLLRDAHIALHGPAHQRHAAPVVVGGVDDLLDAVDVGGEGRDDDLPGGLAEHLVQDGADLALGRDETGDQGVRGVHHEQVHALLAHPREGAQVRQAAVQGQLVHLEVAGDEDLRGAGAHEHCEGVGDGVGDGDELQVEGAHCQTVAFRDDVQAGVAQTVLAQLGGHERQGQVGAVDRDVAPQLEQVRHSTDVVLVAVGEDQADDVVHPLLDPREVGQDQVHAGLGLLREEDTAVDDQEFAFELEDVHVAPHLAEAAQRDDAQRPLLQGRGFAEVLVQGIHTFKSAMPGGAFIARGLVHRGRNPHIRV